MNLKIGSFSTLLSFKNVLIFTLLVISIFFISIWYNENQSSKVKDALLKSANSEMTIYEDKYGREVALTEQLKVEKAETYLSMKFKDSLNFELQKLVRENKSRLDSQGSATVIGTEGKIDKITSTETIIKPTDSLSKNPTYITTFKDDWVEYDIKSNKDSTSLSLSYVDKYSVVIGRDKDQSLNIVKRLISKKVDYAWVVSSSPYSKIKYTKTLQITVPKEPKLSLGIQTGYGISKDLTAAPYVGVGISYRILSIGL